MPLNSIRVHLQRILIEFIFSNLLDSNKVEFPLNFDLGSSCKEFSWKIFGTSMVWLQKYGLRKKRTLCKHQIGTTHVELEPSICRWNHVSEWTSVIGKWHKMSWLWKEGNRIIDVQCFIYSILEPALKSRNHCMEERFYFVH